MCKASPTLLDGPLGTQLSARGIPVPAPWWSAWAITHAPQAIAQLHREYAAAGATVHTANTFRTRRRDVGADWERLARRAVDLARASVPAQHRVAGSLAPLADCYEPWNSPPDPGPEHRELAQVLADAGCDLLLCETFPHVEEGLAAARAALDTGVETWVSFTAGHTATLLTPQELGVAARRARDLGAAAVLVNCIPATRTAEYLRELRGLGLPFGAYANAGSPAEGIGWDAGPQGPQRYAELAARWVDDGASLIGSCCGTGPEHIRALEFVLRTPESCR